MSRVMGLTVNLKVKKSPLLKLALYCIAQLAIYGIIKPETASRWVTWAANQSFKYRIDKGPWQRLEPNIEIDVMVGDG